MVKMGATLCPLEEKLDRLRQLDGFRRWVSLDDKRYCRVCHRFITGRQIEVLNRGAGVLKCPTEGCSSTPEDWIYTSGRQAGCCGNNERIFVTHNGHACVVRRPKHRVGSPDRLFAAHGIAGLRET